MSRRTETAMWLGMFGAPLAWASFHVLGWGVSEAHCLPVNQVSGIAYTTWAAVLGALAIALACTGFGAALITYRSVKGVDKDAPPPEGRVWLLSIAALVLEPLLLVIIVLDVSSALLLSHCHQG